MDVGPLENYVLHLVAMTLVDVGQGLSSGNFVLQALALTLGLQDPDVGTQRRRHDRVARARVNGHLNLDPTIVLALAKQAEAKARGLLATQRRHCPGAYRAIAVVLETDLLDDFAQPMCAILSFDKPADHLVHFRTIAAEIRGQPIEYRHPVVPQQFPVLESIWDVDQ